jgi:hypothetical protein
MLLAHLRSDAKRLNAKLPVRQSRSGEREWLSRVPYEIKHHIKEEESSVWDDAKANFSDDERKQMNVAYLSAKARVKIA